MPTTIIIVHDFFEAWVRMTDKDRTNCLRRGHLARQAGVLWYCETCQEFQRRTMALLERIKRGRLT